MREFTVDRQQVLDALSRTSDLGEDGLRDDYSGRGMYGETCFGVVLASVSEYTQFIVAMIEEFLMDGEGDLQDALDWMSRVQTDSMGWSTIFYFPGVQVVG